MTHLIEAALWPVAVIFVASNARRMFALWIMYRSLRPGPPSQELNAAIEKGIR